jgi:formate--tetrahydrofolate ligase
VPTHLRPILEVAADLGLDPEACTPLGRYKAKVDLLDRATVAFDGASPATGRLVLVSAVTPTPAGEGKTTVSVGLTQGLKRIGASVALCLREPSLGPVFGVKGGGTGGGQAQVEPADDINLHFTGDLHAISSAHNLLAAMVDTDLHFGGPSGLTPATTTWPRVVDMNDRALRKVVIAAGGKAERTTRFDITAASEVMAIMALSASEADLRARIARIVVGRTADGAPVTADDLGATDAMVVLLREALRPNLAQTREGAPAFVHCGPFANIAHGCSSVVATDLALRHADVVLTEAGFGFDLGGEKFLDLKMRQAGLWPRAVVLVATVRALKSHGGGDLTLGLQHLARQLANVRAFGLPPLVALNVFPDDTEAELAEVEAYAAAAGAAAGRSTGFTDGGAGAESLAKRLMALLEATDADPPRPTFLYPEGAPVLDALHAVASTIYGAAEVRLSEAAEADLAWLRQAGFDRLPVCIAKTHLSLTDDPKGGGLASGFPVTVNEFRLSAGAGFVVARMGRIFTMPGLPREPAAKNVRLRPDGSVQGLMQGD